MKKRSGKQSGRGRSAPRPFYKQPPPAPGAAVGEQSAHAEDSAQASETARHNRNELLLKEHYETIRSWGLPFCERRGVSDAESLFHDCLLEILRLPVIEGRGFIILLWLRLRSRCSGAYRKQSNYHKRLLAAAQNLEGNDSPVSYRTEERKALRQALRVLDKNDRTILRLYHWKKMPLTKIAKKFGLTEEATKSRAHRARKMLLRWFRAHAARNAKNSATESA